MANKPEKKKVVLASGVFDLIHLGHVRFLEEAKRAGGENAKLIVIIARDNNVEKMKGRKPIMSENQRRTLVESLKVVDETVLGYEKFDIAEIIQKMKPDIIALGYDQVEMELNVKKHIAKRKLYIEVFRIGKFGANALDSSSKIKQKIIDKLAK